MFHFLFHFLTFWSRTWKSLCFLCFYYYCTIGLISMQLYCFRILIKMFTLLLNFIFSRKIFKKKKLFFFKSYSSV
jgi:hypothetical protein